MASIAVPIEWEEPGDPPALGLVPRSDVDPAQEIEHLRDHLAWVAVAIGTTSRDLLITLCVLYGLEKVHAA